MNQNLTEMIFILDMSGSMDNLRSDTIGGYNTLINQQKNETGDANVTTVLFDDRYIVLHDNVNIHDVPEMTTKEYSPLGMTAMLDAIGRTINSVGQRLASTPEEKRPAKIVVTIVTDGYENASKEFTYSKIKEMIKHQREKYSWIFTFIGANIDTAEVGDNLGIDAKLSKCYTASADGTASVYAAASKAISYTRGISDVATMNCCATVDAIEKILDEVE